MSELAIEDRPVLSHDVAQEAARGEVAYITEHGERIAAIVPADLAAALERLSADELERIAGFMAESGMEDVAALLDDLADRATARAARASIDAGEPVIPWEQIKADAGL